MELIAVEPTTCLRSSSSSSKPRKAEDDVDHCPQDALLNTAPDASSCSSQIQLGELRSTELKVDVSKRADHNSVADGFSSGSFSTGKSSPCIKRKRQMETSAPPLKKSKRKSSSDEIRIRNFPSAKMPPMEEIESFFSKSELFEKKRFSEKYNFDVAKDVPLEGRYQWVQIKP